MSLWLSRPGALFLSKFENANQRARDLYHQLYDSASNATMIVSLKSSGSLFLVGAHENRLIFTSKNGANNPYAAAGLHLFIRHFQLEFGRSNWKTKYEEFVQFLDKEDLSLGCECVSSALGSHGQPAKVDHVVVNAVIDRKTLKPLSPMILVQLSEHYRLLTAGFYVFRNGRVFEAIYDENKNLRTLPYSQIHEQLKAAADGTHEFDYDSWQGDLLEGFVTYCVDRSAITDADLERLKQSKMISPTTTESFPELLPPLSQVFRATVTTEEDAELTKDMLETIGKLVPTYTFTKVKKAEAKKMFSAPPGTDDKFSMQFWSMLQVLNELEIQHEFKVFALNEAPSTFIACIHIIHDRSFLQYEHYREKEGRDHELPMLLRGNFWLVTAGNESGDLQHRFESHVQSPYIQDLKEKGAIPGSIWKFKLFCYIERTFLFRNAGKSLLKHRDVKQFEQQVTTTMRLFQIKVETQEAAMKDLQLWAKFIKNMNEEQKAVFERDYYPAYREFCSKISELRVAAETSCRIQGLLIFLYGSEDMKKVAEEVSLALTKSKAMEPTIDVKVLTMMYSTGCVVASTINNQNLMKMIKTTAKSAGIRRAIVCGLDINETSLIEVNPAISAIELKKTMGMYNSVLNAAAASGFEVVRLDRPSSLLSSSSSAAAVNSENSSEISIWKSQLSRSDEFRALISRACEERDDTIPINIVLFVTMAGMGKNTVLDHLYQRDNFKDLLGFDKDETVCLEKDTLGGQWLSKIEETLNNNQVKVLILNRNCPPNSWGSMLDQLQKMASRAARSITIFAVVPKSEGAIYNGFSLLDAAICYKSIIDRPTHPTNLCTGSSICEGVVAMFYQTFKMPGGYRALHDTISTQLTPNIVQYNYITATDTEAPKDLIEAMEQLVSFKYEDAKEEDVAVVRNACREVVSKYGDWLDSIRVSVPQTTEEIATKFREVQQVAVSKKISRSEYVAVELPCEDVWKVLDSIDTPENIQPHLKRSSYHVTLFHTNNVSQAPLEILKLLGKKIEVVCVGVAQDEHARALVVGELRCLEDGEGVKSLNENPHVTVWTDETVQDVYSNQMLVNPERKFVPFPSPFTLCGLCARSG